MNILNFIKGKNSVISTFVGITDESLKANIIFYEEQLKKSNELKKFKYFLQEEGVFGLFCNKQVCALYENQILSVENVLKDIIKDLQLVYKKDINNPERINKVKSFETLLNYYRDSLFYYDNALKEEWNNQLKEQENFSERYNVSKKKFTIKDLKEMFLKNKQSKEK